MSRAYQLLGWGYAVACAAAAVVFSQSPSSAVAPLVAPVGVAPITNVEPTNTTPAPPQSVGDAGEWFRRIKPECNSLEVASALVRSKPPAGAEGAGYHAACLALAGCIDDSRFVIDSLDSGGRQVAASIVFEIGHPVADAGDDRSAGPIMQLVVEYLPDHYMALYHAGMAQYMLGQRDDARRNIESFLRIYQGNDGWRSNGLTVLGKLNDSTNAGAERQRPAEPE